MNIVPVKWASSQRRSGAAERTKAHMDSRSPAQRPSVRILQERRAREAAEAVREYEACRRAVDAKTERLRALRLAKDAANAAKEGQIGGKSVA